MKRRKKGFGVLILAGVLLVSGCLVPEKFTAEATLNRDKSYSFAYTGTMVFLPYRMEQGGAGDDSGKGKDTRDAKMAVIARELREKEGGSFRKADHVGNGVLDVDYAVAGTLAETYYFPSREAPVISFEPKADGTLVVEGKVKEKDWEELKKIGIEVAGKFSLKTDAEVVEHNAEKTPGLFSGAYVWTIGPGKPPPLMILKGSQ